MRAQVETPYFVFRFADVEVREADFSIKKAGARLPVEPKAFRVLQFLLHHPDCLVRKEELLDAVWGDVAVSENSLTRTVTLLRHLLDDDPRHPRYIETVATVGYRFIARVEVSDEAPPDKRPASANGASSEGIGTETLLSEAVDEAVPPSVTCDAVVIAASSLSGSRRRGIRRSWALGAGLVCLFAIYSISYLRRPLPIPQVTKFTQLTHDGKAKNLRGTDGVRLFFNVGFKLQQPIAQVLISGGDIAPIPIQLPKPELFDVSPDGSSLLVKSTDENRTSLWSIGVSGSPLRHLADDEVTGAAWSPDSKYVAYTTIKGLNSIRSDGTEARALFSNPSHAENTGLGSPRWSPDGRTIRFTSEGRLWEISADGSNPHPMHPNWRPTFIECCGSWTADGKFFIFRVNEAPWRSSRGAIPEAELWALDERRGLFRSGASEPIQLAVGPIRWGFPIPSKDNARVFARGNTWHGELTRYNAQSKKLEPYLGGISAEFVAFSPDGKSVVYGSFPEGILWRANRDGSNPMQLTNPPWYPMNPRWSPDGTRLIFMRINTEGRTESYIMPSLGGAPQPLLPGDRFSQGDPNWSPDGRKIVTSTDYYGSLEATKDIIRILDLATHEVTTLQGSRGMWSPRWSPEGRFIAGLDSDWNLVVFDFKSQRWSTLQKGRLGYPTWSHDGRFLYFLNAFDEDPGVYRIRPSGGKAELVVDLKGVRLSSMTVAWFGLDPEDTPLLLRDVGTDEIYALTLEQK
jgi:DNA-binding winged helix-turn-helix (wHTH) protein/Tol biopolymer transport system component